MAPNRGLSPLRLAVPCLQLSAENGLVSEKPVLHPCLPVLARLLLPLSSSQRANPLKRRFSLPPRTVRRTRRHCRATRRDHDHDILCSGRADPIVAGPVVVGPVGREPPDGILDLTEQIRQASVKHASLSYSGDACIHPLFLTYSATHCLQECEFCTIGLPVPATTNSRHEQGN